MTKQRPTSLWGKLGIVVTILASIISAFVFVTGIPNASAALKWLEDKHKAIPREGTNNPDPYPSTRPYELDILNELPSNCSDLLRYDWRTFAASDQGSMVVQGRFGQGSDPWVECQDSYLEILVEAAVRKAPAVLSDLPESQRRWIMYRKEFCREQVAAESGQGLGAFLDHYSCMGDVGDERIALISKLKRRYSR